MTDRWMDRLSEYLDGELAPADREALEMHLAGCDACASTLAELRAVVHRAHSLTDPAAPPALWGRIAAEIGAAPRRETPVVELATRRQRPARRLSFSVPQLAAAAVALMAVSAGAMWALLRDGQVVGMPVAATPVSAIAGDARLVSVDPAATAAYELAVEDLEKVLQESRGRLDPTTVAALEENLALIDRAIADARAALARDPASEYLNTYLADRMRHKLSLLRDAASIVRADT